jgi:short-subunit dehydrogenase
LNILILGASSQIGCELALCFSKGNDLILLGRNKESLNSVAQKCIEAGSPKVDLLAQDMVADADDLIRKLGGVQIDLVINLVSATSRVKDSELLPSQLEAYVKSDLLVPVRLIQYLSETAIKPLKVIFISSVLASVKSPDRLLYGSLKSLQEMCLSKLLDKRKGNELLVVKVGKVIPHEQSSGKAKQLAAVIYRAHLNRCEILNYGWTGRIYFWLFNFQPLVFKLVVQLQRLIRERK